MLETRRRSVAKALSWRLISLFITTGVAWKATGRMDVAASVGLVDMAVKMGLFYMHERWWSRVKYGIRPPEYEI
jgi:adenylylsulfate kinase